MTWTKITIYKYFLLLFFCFDKKNHIKRNLHCFKKKLNTQKMSTFSVRCFGFTCESRQYHFDFNHIENSVILFLSLIGFFCTLISWLIYKTGEHKRNSIAISVQIGNFMRTSCFFYHKRIFWDLLLLLLFFSPSFCLSFALNVVVNAGIWLFK